MKKHQLLSKMDIYEKLDFQLNALHCLLATAGSELNEDQHMACISLCIDLENSKSDQYAIIKNAVHGGGD